MFTFTPPPIYNKVAVACWKSKEISLRLLHTAQNGKSVCVPSIYPQLAFRNLCGEHERYSIMLLSSQLKLQIIPASRPSEETF